MPDSVDASATASVIVPVRDDRRIVDCVAALLAQDYPDDRLEIIIVDNGSTRITPKAALHEAGFDDARLVFAATTEAGSYSARNLGVSLARGQVLAFTDADCRPEADWLRQAVRALNTEADVVAGRVLVHARQPARPHPVEAYEIVNAFPQHKYVARGGGCVTANLVTTRAVFDATGPFDSRLMSGADIEWGQRATKRGFRTMYVPAALVNHPARASYREMSAKLDRVLAGRAQRDRLEGRTARRPWPTWRSWIPPLGAIRRARHDRLVSPRARAALVVGEFYHRYAAVVIATRMTARSRRKP